LSSNSGQLGMSSNKPAARNLQEEHALEACKMLGSGP
jgi:hypothetical protein